MKYIINESQLDRFIYQYLDAIIDPNKLEKFHPFDYDDDGEEYEDKSRVYVDYDDDTLFMWYDESHWADTDYAKTYKKNSPLVDINDRNFETSLKSNFGDRWYDGFKKWFTENTGLPVNKLFVEL